MKVIITITKKRTITLTIDGYSTVYRNAVMDGKQIQKNKDGYPVLVTLECPFIVFYK